MRQIFFLSLLAGLLIPTHSVLAADVPRVVVTALFRDKAMVELDGENVFLRVGEGARSGVRLIQADSKKAVIEVNGKEGTYWLGSYSSSKLSEPERRIVRIPSKNGMFFTSGMINGRRVKFLIDTGASSVGIPRLIADRLQIEYLKKGRPVVVSTAGGLRNGWEVKLNSVTVGGITLYHIRGIVADTLHDEVQEDVLLGMSFLSHLKFSQEQGLVVLEAKYN